MSLVRPDASPATVLLIDDDEFVARSLRQYLVTTGLRVESAPDAATAEELMREQAYSVVLVDPYLTGSLHDDGGTLIGSIRRLQPAAALIVLTGYRSRDIIVAAAAVNVVAVLGKPQSVVFLKDMIVAAVDNRAPASPIADA